MYYICNDRCAYPSKGSSAGIPRCPLSLSAAWHDDNTTARPTPNQCIKEPKVETVAVTITETITTDTLTLTTTVTSIETSMLLPAYTTTSVPHTDHGCSQGDPTVY